MTRRELINASLAAVPVAAAPPSIAAENRRPGATVVALGTVARPGWARATHHTQFVESRAWQGVTRAPN